MNSAFFCSKLFNMIKRSMLLTLKQMVPGLVPYTGEGGGGRGKEVGGYSFFFLFVSASPPPPHFLRAMGVVEKGGLITDRDGERWRRRRRERPGYTDFPLREKTRREKASAAASRFQRTRSESRSISRGRMTDPRRPPPLPGPLPMATHTRAHSSTRRGYHCLNLT